MSTITAGDAFPNLRLATVDGVVQLRDRWRDGPLVVMFMRHFGCAFCREQLIRVGGAFDELREAGADVVAIFQYTAEATHDFCASREVPFDCLADPWHEAYATVSLGRGTRRTLLGWRVAKRYPEAIRLTGSPGGGPKGGDMAQLPGTFVIDRSGRVRLAHYSENSADNPPVATLLDVVRAVA